MITVLVEGRSDEIALSTLAARLEVPEFVMLPVGGSKGARRALAGLPGRTVVGLVDAAERADFEQVLDVVFVCDPDLEVEFLRALGHDEVLAVLDRAGDLESFCRLQRQPALREAPIERQLTRFFAGRSGNKARYAGLMAEAVPANRIPRPLAALLRHVADQPTST